MSGTTLNLHWLGENIEQVSLGLNKAQELLARQHPELLRQCAVAVLNVANRYTPPNRGGMGKGRKQSGYGQKNVKSLKIRIAAEITGREELNPTVLPTAVPLKDGRGILWEGPAFAWGGYGFRVPRPLKGKKSFPRVKYVDPIEVLRARRFRRAGDVVRAQNTLPSDGIRWVKKGDLKRAVKFYQARAGSLITAWLPAARSLSAGNAQRDYDVSKFRRSGYARLEMNRWDSSLTMGGDWGRLIVARRYAPYFLDAVDNASYGVVQNTIAQFMKHFLR